MNTALLSKKTDDWKTPKYIYDQVLELGMFDPCPFQSAEDGLQKEWGQKNFVNPPYSQLKKWIEKSIEEAKKGKEIILLIPSRTDTKAFRLMFDYGADFVFVEGRLRFNEANFAPFPSLICVLRGGGYQIFI